METGIAIKDTLQPITVSPQQQVDKAAEMAKVLQGVVKQAGLSKRFGGEKEHLYFEAWLTLGRFFNCTPVTEWTKPITEDGKIIGWESRVNVTDSEGRIIGCAENMCMKDEPNWRNKPNYALRSMAQTRAAGKALRSIFSWVAVLAGYSGTPAEEMSEEFHHEEPKSDKPAPPQSNLGDSDVITSNQNKRLWAITKSKEPDDARARDFIDWLKEQPDLYTIEVEGKKHLTKQAVSRLFNDGDKVLNQKFVEFKKE